MKILNRLAWHFASSNSEEDGSHPLDELLAYASYHFEYEEGVETLEQGEVLLSLGCDFAQGYGISPPIAPDKLADWFARWKPFPQWAVNSTLPQ